MFAPFSKLKTIQYITTGGVLKELSVDNTSNNFMSAAKEALGSWYRCCGPISWFNEARDFVQMTAWSCHLIHWYENVSSLQSQPSVDALICEFDWEFKQHDTHTKIHFKHQSDSPNLNRIITSKEKMERRPGAFLLGSWLSKANFTSDSSRPCFNGTGFGA